MGNSANISNERHTQILAEYKKVKHCEDQRFGKVTLLEHKLTRDLAVFKEISMQCDGDSRDALQKLEARGKMQNANLISLISYSCNVESSLCSSFCKNYLLIEQISSDLEQEIVERKSLNYPYSEKEVWFLIFCTMNTMHYLNLFNITHNGIRLSTVYICAGSRYKIADNLILAVPSLYSLAFTSSNSDRASGIFISPDLMTSLEKRLISPKHNEEKSDIFTLGIIYIYAALLCPMDYCYDYQNFLIKEHLIEEKISEIRSIYGRDLAEFIGKLVCFEEKLRPRYRDIWKDLQKIASDKGFEFAYLLEDESEKEKVLDTLEEKYHKKIFDIAPVIEKQPSPYSQIEFKQSILVTQEILLPGLDKEPAPLKENRVRKNYGGGTGDGVISTIIRKYEPEVMNNRNVSLTLYKSIKKEVKTTEKAEVNRSQDQKVLAELKVNSVNGSSDQTDFGKKAALLNRIKAENKTKVKVREAYKGYFYEGEKVGGMKCGSGTLVFPNGDSYIGEFKNNRMNGKGQMKDKDNKLLYKGDFLDNKYHGIGALYNDKPKALTEPFDYKDFIMLFNFWEKYEGEFKQGRKEGFGVLCLTNGEKFSGSFVNNIISGKGTFYKLKGGVVCGTWENNRLIEEGV